MMSRILHLSDGRSVRLLEAGAGQPLVLLHGVGLQAEAWGPQIEHLSRFARVIAPDLPGHGESQGLPSGARLPEYVAWVVRLIEALGRGTVSIAGHSMGAMISAGVAIERPDLIRRAALLNAVYQRNPVAREAVEARAQEIAAGRGNKDAPLSRWFDASQITLRNEVAAWLSKVDRSGYATAYKAFAEGDRVYGDRLDEIRCPTLVLTGDGDPNSTAAMTEAMAAKIPLGHAVVIEGHRHMVNLTASEAVSKSLTEWLQAEEVV